jgi:hypothetical protein
MKKSVKPLPDRPADQGVQSRRNRRKKRKETEDRTLKEHSGQDIEDICDYMSLSL